VAIACREQGGARWLVLREHRLAGPAHQLPVIERAEVLRALDRVAHRIVVSR
jgi:hypothetical protein